MTSTHAMPRRITPTWLPAIVAAAVMVLVGAAACPAAPADDQTTGKGPDTRPATSRPATRPAASKPAAHVSRPAGDPEPATSRPATQPAASGPAGPISRPAGDPKTGGEFWRSSDGRSAAGTLWKLLAYVVVILILGAAALIVTKKLLPRLRAAGGREMAVVETVHLGPRTTVHLVEAAGRRFMLGATRDRVSMLAELTGTFPDIAEVARKMDQADAAPAPEGAE